MSFFSISQIFMNAKLYPKGLISICLLLSAIWQQSLSQLIFPKNMLTFSYPITLYGSVNILGIPGNKSRCSWNNVYDCRWIQFTKPCIQPNLLIAHLNGIDMFDFKTWQFCSVDIKEMPMLLDESVKWTHCLSWLFLCNINYWVLPICSFVTVMIVN